MTLGGAEVQDNGPTITATPLFGGTNCSLVSLSSIRAGFRATERRSFQVTTLHI